MILKLLKILIIFFLINTLILFDILFHTKINSANFLNSLDIVFIFFVYLSSVNPRKPYFYWAVYAFLVADLFHSGIFGVNALSKIVALMIINWLLLNIFTNRSITTAFSAGVISIFTFNILFILISFLAVGFYQESSAYKEIISKSTLISIAVNSVFLTLAYALSSLLSRKMKPEYIGIQY